MLSVLDSSDLLGAAALSLHGHPQIRNCSEASHGVMRLLIGVMRLLIGVVRLLMGVVRLLIGVIRLLMGIIRLLIGVVRFLIGAMRLLMVERGRSSLHLHLAIF